MTDKKKKRSPDPKSYMRDLHPDLFSDSEIIKTSQLSKELLEYHLDTMTSRSQEAEFAYFCRLIAEKEICPNLRSQTGPTGGGDSKADSETLPVSSEISELWIGADPKAAEERWAFAFSAAKDWKKKARSDIEKIAKTDRGYRRAYYLSNQFARDKDRADLEDELKAEFGLDVFILDRNWLVTRIYEHGHVNLAIDALGLDASFKAEVRTGPRDLVRERELEELNTSIQDSGRYGNSKYQLAEDCLRAALLARGLERPRNEIDGHFARAGQIAEAVGERSQRLRVAYNYAWTAVYWFNDPALLNSLYQTVEALAVCSDEAKDLELLQNLWQSLAPLTWSKAISEEDARLEGRKDSLANALEKIAANETRPNNAMQARTGRILLKSYDAMLSPSDGAFDHIWEEFGKVVDDAEHLGDYPFERFANLVRMFGNLGFEGNAYDQLYEKVLHALEKRRTETAGGEMLLETGFQKLKRGKYYDAIRAFGRALERFIKHENKDELVNTLMGLSSAYEKVGLLWAARNCALVASERLIERGDLTSTSPVIIPCLKRLAGLEVQLGRLPCFIEAASLMNAFIQILQIPQERIAEISAEVETLDAILGILLINADLDQLRLLENVPDALERSGMFMPRVALLYALGYRDELREEGFPLERFSDQELERFMHRMMEQPARHQIPEVPILMEEPIVRFSTVILGCEISVEAANNDSSIYLAEALLGAMEAFFSTSLDQRAFPYRSEAIITVGVGNVSEPFTIETKSGGGFSYLEIRHPIGHPNRTIEYRQKFRDQMLSALAQVLLHIAMVEDVEAYFDNVAGAERGFSRALIFCEIDISSENIFGTDKRLRLSALINEEDKKYPLKRSSKWTDGLTFVVPGTPEDDEIETDIGMPGAAPVPKLHRRRRVASFIDPHLWRKAGWRGTMYMHGPGHPTVIAIGFKDIEAGREIFLGIRKRLGSSDTKNILRVTIVTGVSRDSPSHYNIVVGTNPTEEDLRDGQPVMAVSRVNQMTPSSATNLEAFRKAAISGTTYLIAPVQFDPSNPVQQPEMDLAIEKTEIVFRKAWEIGPNDIDIMGIREDDDPIIPDGVNDAPVLELLKRRKAKE